MSNTCINTLQQAVINTLAAVVAHEGSALGLGGDVDEISTAVIGLRHAGRHDFVQRYAAASEALHNNWTRRVGTSSYHKPLWMAVDNTLSRFAREVSTSIGYKGPWVLGAYGPSSGS